MSRQPIDLPRARQPSLTTKRGHTKAVYLTQEQLDRIFTDIANGVDYGDATHNAGTSGVQFLRRVKREPELQARLAEAKRQRAALRSNRE